MKLDDIFKLAWQNLMRRKSRTFLTGLGVGIGCCSILIMMSIGVGLSQSQMKMLESMGDLTKITVYPYGSAGSQDLKLDAEALQSIQSMDHVKNAVGLLEMNSSVTSGLNAQNGRYYSEYITMAALEGDEGLASLEAIEGTLDLDSRNAAEIPVLVGEHQAYSFWDKYRPEGSNSVSYYEFDETGQTPDPFLNPLTNTYTLTVNAGSEPDTELTYTLRPVGIVKEDWNVGYVTSEGLILSSQALAKIQQEAYKKAGLTNLSMTYSQVFVYADGVDSVDELEKSIQSLGFSTYSIAGIRKSLQEQTLLIQMILGGIGSISLLVAAIGITNTMIMSISERSREIGIMKALGCRLKDIRLLFLSEAGMIGLIGGVGGVVVSYIISYVINRIGGAYAGAEVSIIPWWLALFGLVFSVGIGLISGYYPSNKAVKIPALEAIRRE